MEEMHDPSEIEREETISEPSRQVNRSTRLRE
jgi:hypothetical protein